MSKISTSERKETQLPLPKVPPMIRAKTLLDSSMMHSWEKQCRVLQRVAMAQQLHPQAHHQQVEMSWFQLRLEWQTLYADVLGEVMATPLPEYGDDADENLEAEQEYEEDVRAAVYPIMMMELFQRDQPLGGDEDQELAAPASGADEMELDPMTKVTATGSRLHWLQLLLHERELRHQKQQRLYRLRDPDQATTVLDVRRTPVAGHILGNPISYDDLSSAGGISENVSFASASTRSTSPSLMSPPRSPIPVPLKPSGPQTATPTAAELLYQRMLATPSPQVPTDYDTLRFDVEARNAVVSGRLERKKAVLASLSGEQEIPCPILA